MILYGLNTELREVLELSRLQRIFEIYDSEEQALSALRLANSIEKSAPPCFWTHFAQDSDPFVIEAPHSGQRG